MRPELIGDWPQMRERYIRWWKGEDIGRCLLWLTAPNPATRDEPPPPRPQDPLERWTNLDYLNALNDWNQRRTLCFADAYPMWSPGYPGAVSVPTFLGAEITLDHVTGWHEPCLTGETWDPESIRLDRSGFWYTFGLRMLHNACLRSAGRCFPSMGAFGGTGDTLAALRDSNRLLFDVTDRPDLVKRSEQIIMDAWIEVFTLFHDITKAVTDFGSTCWFPLWSPGKFYPTHNDFSYMISPDMFRELFLPQLIRQTEFLDATVYHVDGVAAFTHVPMLCELPRIQAFQIAPGAGKPSPLHYRSVLEYVQSRGRNLHISLPCGEVEAAVDTLSRKGLCIATSATSVEEAERTLDLVRRRSHL